MKAEDLDTAITLYQEALYSGEELKKYPQLNDLKGIVYNNLGVTHFYKFIELSNQVDSSDPTRLSPELVKPIVENMNNGIKFLKKSVRELEKIDARLKSFEDANVEVTLTDLETKMLFEDFFDPKILDIVKPNF
jgi:tetratricopeptide (TPR) repeat protein